METIGERIKRLRLEQNITQEEIAKSVGYTSRSSIVKVETNLVDLSQSKIMAFAKALKTTPTYLLGFEDKRKENFILICFNGKEKKYLLNEEQIKIIEAMLKQFTKEN